MKKVCTFLLSAVCLPVFVLAAGPHTTHEISAKTGEWAGCLVMASPHEAGYFTDVSGEQKWGSQVDFELKETAPFAFGFAFELPGTDFDVSYTVTLVKKSEVNGLGSPLFASPACQFNVSAKGPANPDVRTESYHGADCRYIITGHGEDFLVS